MKKIAFVNVFQESVNRGAETFVYQLSERLSKKYAVEVISGSSKPKPRWPFLWRFFLDPNGLTILLFTLKSVPKIFSGRYDVVIPVNGGPMPIIIRIITWIYGGKMIVSGQSGMGWDERVNLWSFPDAFVALSGASEKWARRVNPFIKTVKISNGVDTAIFKKSAGSVKIELIKPIVLCVAALTGAKRIDLTIRAVSKLKSFSLLLVGSGGDEESRITALGKKLLGERFLYKSFPHSKMPEVFGLCDVFTLASKSYFSFEIAIVEAMAMGIPVVVNDDPIRREIAGDIGYYVDPENTEAYAKTLDEALVSSEKRKKMGIARSKEFDWQTVSDKYVDLISDITK